MNLLQSCGLLLFLVLYGGEFSESNVIRSNTLSSVIPRVSSSIAPAKSMVDYVVPNGYPLEEYEIVTEDGYILGAFRIPHGRNSTSTNRPPIILQHGIFASSSCFVMGNPEKALAFVLAEAGYDVWLSNSRGNPYSSRHVTLDPVKDAKQFYDFSFHEMGYYDLPAVMDFVLNATNNSQLSYIGHSQGTTEFLVLTSTRPEYNAKIKVAAMMAPVGFMSDVQGTLKFLTYFSEVLKMLTNYFHIYNICKNWNIPSVITFPSSLMPPIANNFLSSISGYDAEQFNKSIIPIVLKQGSPGASTKQLRHYGQIIKSDDAFSMFDYGKEENMKRYNQSTPPEYDLSKITTHMNLHYSTNDYISRVKDVEKLHSKVPQSTLVEVSFNLFNHLDFLWAKDVNELLYNRLIKLLKV